MRWIFLCDVKLVKVSLTTIILLIISQLKMSQMENDHGGDVTDLFSTVYFDVDEVKESAIVAKTTQLMLRKQVKNGRKLVENLESELKEAKIELTRSQTHRLFCLVVSMHIPHRWLSLFYVLRMLCR